MNLRNIKIGSRLLLGFGILIMLIAILGIMSVRHLNQTGKTFDDMYRHPFTVSNTVREINANIIAMHRSMKDVVLAENEFQMEIAERKVHELEKTVLEHFDIVFERYLGNIDDVQRAYDDFLNWKPIRNEVIELWNEGRVDEAIAITKGKGARHVEKLNHHVSELINFANNKAKSFEENVHKSEKRALIIFLLFITLAITLSTFVVLVITYSIITPLKSINRVSESIQNGKLETRNNTDHNDEITQLSIGFNNMIDTIQSKNRVQKKTSKINRSGIGNHSIKKYSESLLECLNNITNADCSALYKLSDDGLTFEHIYSIGGNEQIRNSIHAAVPEGELEKLLKNKSINHIRNNANSQIVYSSVLIKYLINEIILIPVLIDNDVKALISLSTIRDFDDESLQVIKQSWFIINSTYSTILSNEITKHLATELEGTNQKLHAQWEELQNQSTELQEQNLELEMQRDQVEEANRLKSEFLSNMSHELRTPLNSVLALSKVLIMQTKDRLDEDEFNYLEIIERNGKNLLNLINDILDLSKVEAGKIDLQPKNVSISNLINNSVENLKGIAEDKHLQLIIKLPSTPIHIETDEKRLYQILVNILGNAIKFTDKGSVTIEVLEFEKAIEINIIDNGIGISKEELSTIFEEFRQVDGSTSRSFEGTGLGLAITLKFVNALMGKIDVKSEPGIGSTFTVTLPKKWKGANVIQKHDIKKITSAKNKKSILIIDDDVEMVNNMAKNLEKSGFNILRCTAASNAVALAEEHQPYAITLDIIMPELDGFEVLQQLKSNKKTKHIPIIIVTVSNDLSTGFALGAAGFINKPVIKEDLINEINRLVLLPKKVMVVDDDKIDRLHYQKIFTQAKIDSIILDSGFSCLTELKSEIPDILILDLMMPEMDGFSVLNQIRNNSKTANLPVIIVTAKDLSEDEKNKLSIQSSAIYSKSNLYSENFIDKIKETLGESSVPIQNINNDILVVEDNESALIQIEKALKKGNFNITFANNGYEAIQRINENTPDAIILDLMMPEMDGFEFLDRLEDKSIPVLILTAKNLNTDELNQLSKHNIVYFVQKGDIDSKGFLTKVKSMLPVDEQMFQYSHTSQIQKDKDNNKNNIETILLIEDNKDNRITINAILAKDYNIIEAVDGDEGIAIAEQENPDLILCDIALPQKSGIEVMKQLKYSSKTKDIPIVALTAKAMKDDKDKFLAAGFDAYVSKPIDIDELTSTIKSFDLKQKNG